MLGLKLREEFRGKRLKGTAIELANDNKTGATQIAAEDFLEITYPTHDVLKGLEATGPTHGRPIVIIGERGLGKSHILAALFHALSHAAATKKWLTSWASVLGNPKMEAIGLRDGMLVIGESLHRQRYKFLWDVLLDRHPHGKYIRGKWEGMDANKPDIPSDQLILELLKNQPVALLLDEFQTWFDGLTSTKQYPWKVWAFNFIQILSEIAKEHPDLLVLVVSVRNGSTDAYQQIRRVAPVEIDFKGASAQIDRRRLLLHRLFENRRQIAPDDVEATIKVHLSEYFRLLSVPAVEQGRKLRDFVEAWPYAPHLLQLLEDQVLVATDAQETRDLIRILANLYKAHGEAAPILTAADFRLDDDASGIGALLDSVANAHQVSLRGKALRNVTSVIEAVPTVKVDAPHLNELMGALWLRSIAVGNLAGATPATLQADITKASAIDDNAFQVELTTVVGNSFNIHQDGDRYVFKDEENAGAKLMAYARNDKLFTDGSDLVQLAKEIRYVLSGGEEVAKAFRVIPLPKDWLNDPWGKVEESERPDNWDERTPILVLPEEPDKLGERLGPWLAEKLQKRRNAVRFLVPRNGSTNAYLDRDLVILARAELKANEWRTQNSEFANLHRKYQAELRGILAKRFDRFAVLHRWDFGNQAQCEFHVEAVKEQGAKIPEAIEKALREDLFIPEDFEALVLEAAAGGSSVGKLIKELQEPRPAGKDCIVWLGEPLMKERIIRLCARGKLAVNLRGMDYLQALPGEDEETAWKRMRSSLGTGKHLDETFLLAPEAVPAAAGAQPVVPDTPTPPPGGGGLFGGGDVTGDPGTPVGPVTPPETGDIFGGSGKVRKPLSNPAASPLNLIGKLENWGIGPSTRVHEVTIKLQEANGAQLKELLKKLPETIKYELGLEKEE